MTATHRWERPTSPPAEEGPAGRGARSPRDLVYELTLTVSPFKIIALIVNFAIVVYLLFAKRLFGLRGGVEAERREHERDMGWQALERSAPEAAGAALGPSAG